MSISPQKLEIDQIQPSSQEELVQFVLATLVKPQMPPTDTLDEALVKTPAFEQLMEAILALRELSASLAQGELQKSSRARGYIIGNLKALQANLRHLSWQARQIAQGDFSQRVDFLGEFSDSFNEMTEKLYKTTNMLLDSANRDALTGVLNRQGINSIIPDMFSDPEKRFCVLMMDIDFFKKFNDTYGHGVGDEVLQEVARRLQSQFRSEDYFVRFGGEEFLGILTDTSLEVGQAVCKRLLQCISESPVQSKTSGELKVTVSIGLSERDPTDASFEDVLKRSDTALYSAKSGGRNQYCVLDSMGNPVSS